MRTIGHNISSFNNLSPGAVEFHYNCEDNISAGAICLI